MYTAKQWNAITQARRQELLGTHTYFPRNRYGIPEGYYRDGDVVGLLRKFKKQPETIQFIADMLE